MCDYGALDHLDGSHLAPARNMFHRPFVYKREGVWFIIFDSKHIDAHFDSLVDAYAFAQALVMGSWKAMNIQ